jgi:hypothetical protein
MSDIAGWCRDLWDRGRATVEVGGPLLVEHIEAFKCAYNRIRDLEAELAKAPTSWTCLYCGEQLADRSTALLHATVCEKWPYREELAEADKGTIRVPAVKGVSGRPLPDLTDTPHRCRFQRQVKAAEAAKAREPE